MSDRYKFRGKRIDNNQWYYGSYLYLHNPPKYDWNGAKHESKEDIHFIIDEKDVNYKVYPETVGQCTGKKDKNNNLIFKGDIVRFYFDNDEIIAVIEWDDDECRFYLNTTDFFKDKYVTDYEIVNQEEYEVIGNIYENHDLLK